MKLKKLCAIVMSCALLITTGCSSTNTQSKDDSKKSDVQETTSASYPIKIKHAYGETIIESEPKNIATISWGNQDVPLALGITPVGVSKANYGETEENGLLPWTGEKYNELGVDKPVVFNDVDGIDYEAISDSNPDVILAAYSGITQEEYDLLSQIAPVVAYPTEAWQTLWRDQININATAIGKKDEGEALVKEPSDPRVAYLTDLGLEFPESISKLAEGSNSFYVEISSENIDILEDADIIVCYGNDGLLKSLQDDTLLSKVPAIANGSVAVIEDGSALAASCTPSALSIPAKIDEYLKVIGDAASKVK